MKGQVSIIGDDLLQVQFPHEPEISPLPDIHALAARLRSAGTWQEVVAGGETLTVQFDLSKDNIDSALDRLRQTLVEPLAAEKTPQALVEMPVCYEAPFALDMDLLSRCLGLSSTQIIKAHLAARCRVDFLGFTPGFAYCSGLPDVLETARLDQPRVHVPAGSVGIAGGRCGIYALAGPGGWPIIGRTPARLFDPGQANPFVLLEGVEIRFRRIDRAAFEKMQAGTP